jgi:hypothetical protein
MAAVDQEPGRVLPHLPGIRAGVGDDFDEPVLNRREHG